MEYSKSKEIFKFSGFIILLFLLGSAIIMNPVLAQEKEELTDEDITFAVESELRIDDGVQSHLIDVKTHDGVVTLSGSVNNILSKDRAVRIAETIKAVRVVVNNIEVSPVYRSDEQIRNDVQKALLNDPATESYEIDVKVDDGRVILTGTVESWAEKELAAEVAKGVKGIKELENEINIEYTEERTDFEITNEIKRRLESSVWIDEALVEVETENGEVKLSGTVGSASEKSRVYSAAWVVGVESVNDDNLEVKWWARDNMRRESKYKDKSDEEIKEAVQDAFLWDPRVISFKPDIYVEDGVVTLKGTMESLAAKKAAEKDAENTIGVVRVRNFINVRPAEMLSDKDITQKVENALIINSVVDRYELNVTTINGKVYLYGRVNSEFEKNKAEEVASNIKSVIEVDNNIKVDDEWELKSDKEIKEDVENQLYWSFAVDEDDVDVTVDHGIVTLTGEVETKWEEQAAIKNAFDGGAKQVVNSLDVTFNFGWSQKGQTFTWPEYRPHSYWPYNP